MDNKRVRLYVIFNIVSVILALTLNFLAVTLPLNNKTTEELSDKYINYFVPEGFAFSIWGIIYTLLIIFMIYQAYSFYKSKIETIKLIIAIGPWFFISGLANASWIIAWHFEYILLSLLIMLILLSSLTKIYLTLNDLRPHFTIDNVMILAPFSVYLAWISVATIANVTTVLVSNAWGGWGIGPEIWAVIMICIACLLGILAVLIRQDVLFASVIVCALWGIYSKQSISIDEAAHIVTTYAKYGMTMLLIYSILTVLGRRTYFNISKT